MDTITHGLTGLLLGRAFPSQEGRRAATAAFVIGAVLPDADNIASVLGSELYLRVHRGVSHSFAGVVVTSLIVALLLRRYGKWKDLKSLYLFVLIGQLSHIALDLLNSYGTQIFQPFSDARIALDILFIVDLAFTGIIVAGIMLSRGRPSRARAALTILAAYVGLATVFHLRAETAVREAAERHGVRVVSSWALPRLGEMPALPDLGIGRRAEAAPGARGGRSAAPGAPSPERGFPLPAGPFAWNGFVDDGKTYLRAEVDPLSESVRWRERERRGRSTPEVGPLLGMSDVQTYLWFARFPIVHVSSAGGTTVLTFSDLRFGGTPVRRPFLLRITESPGRSPRARWGE